MKAIFVRHAKAVELGLSERNDLLRPLTKEGRETAFKVFNVLSKVCQTPDLILSSEAVRAVETAELLAKSFSMEKIVRTKYLNPGCTFKDLKKLLQDVGQQAKNVMLVGHEPDFSEIISEVVADGHLRIEMKKASCTAVDMDKTCKGTLTFVLPPAIGSLYS